MSDANEGLRELYGQIRLTLETDNEPLMLRLLGHSPETLKGLWAFMQASLIGGGGRVKRTTKELIALAAASSARAEHLKDVMLGILEERGIDPAVINDLVENGETRRLPEHTRKILLFVRRAALDPALLNDEDFEALQKAGLSDADVAEIVGFAGLISCLITMTRAFGLTQPRA